MEENVSLLPPERKVVKDYVPLAAAARPPADTTVVHPLTGQHVPLHSLGEALRVDLLNPVVKAAHEAPQASNAVDVEGNLRRFAAQRTDLFDADQPVQAPSSAPARPWDGLAATATARRQLREGAERARTALADHALQRSSETVSTAMPAGVDR